HAKRADDPSLDGEACRASRATGAIEVGATRPGRAVAIVDRVVALTEVAESIGAGEAERQTETPAVPVGWCLSVQDDGVASLRAGAGVQGNACETWLGALGEAHRARPVVVPGEPEPVDGAVIDEWVEVIDPVVLWIWLGLGGEAGGT